jgi:threonine efflux protein
VSKRKQSESRQLHQPSSGSTSKLSSDIVELGSSNISHNLKMLPLSLSLSPSLTLLFAIIAADVAANFTPGPSMLLVISRSLRSRAHGLAVVGGIAVSNILLFSATLFLVGKITVLSEVVRQALKIIFAVYLGWLGVKAIRSGSLNRQKKGEVSGFNPVEVRVGDYGNEESGRRGKLAIAEFGDSLKAGCMTSLTNPSSTSYFLSLSTVLVQNNTSALIRIGAIVGIVSAVIVSYGSFVLLCSWPPLMRAVQALSGWLDIFTGSLFLLFSTSLLLS